MVQKSFGQTIGVSMLTSAMTKIAITSRQNSSRESINYQLRDTNQARSLAINPVLTILTCILILQGCKQSATDEHLNTLVNEISSSIETIKYINPDGSRVFFTFRGDKSSYELRYIDLATGSEHVVPLEYPIDEIDRWSPNGRYLLIQCVGAFKNYSGHDFARPAWLLVLDAADFTITRLGAGWDVFEENPVWCTDERLIYTSTDLSDKGSKPIRYVVDWKTGKRQETLDVQKWKDLQPLHNNKVRLMRLDQNKLAFTDNGLMYALDLDNSNITQLSYITEESIVPNWVNPCVASGDILYCGTRTNLPKRNLFLLKSSSSALSMQQLSHYVPSPNLLEPGYQSESDPEVSTLSRLGYQGPFRLNQDHTYNGKWLQEGRGHAYIGNENNTFYLALRPENPSESTNLFTLGHINNYMPNPAGDKVYAVATPEPGSPCGLWEYDLKTHSLRELRSGSRIPLLHAKLARVQKLEIPSFDGLMIQGYLFTTNTIDGAKKTGTVIYIPPRTYQMRRNYDLQPELIANCGFNIVGINYRGMDGFGTDFSRLYDAKEAAKDVLYVTRHLINTGVIGHGPLCLLSQSLGSEVMKEVLVLEPGLWKAAIFQGSVIWGGFDAFQTNHFPRLFITIGREDPAFPFMRDFETWAQSRDISVKTFYLDNYSHYKGDLSKGNQQEKEIARFLGEIGLQESRSKD
jgi:hypothetical protein